MKFVEFVMENWYMVILMLAVAIVVGAGVARFFSLPSGEQREKVKEWLLLAVTDAEKELGSGTGQLKLRYVYDLFLQRFPAIAKMVSFDTFAYWVDEALIDMREMLQNNKNVSRLVNGEEGAADGTN